MVMIANWTRIAIRPKIIAAHINKHEAMPSPTVLNYITIGATVIATALSILSIFAVLLERRRAITPALNHIIEHHPDHIVIKLQFGRLTNQTYQIHEIMAVGIPRPNILGYTNFNKNSICYISPKPKQSLNISVRPSLFVNEPVQKFLLA